MADLEELLIKVNSDLGDLGGIDSAVKALEGLRDFSAKAEKGARSLLGLSAAFVALNREGKNTTGISNLKNQVDSLIGILDKLANHTKNADKSIQQLSALGDALKKFAGVSESLKGLDGITKGVNDMVGVLGALGNLGSASKSIKGVGNIGKDLNNAAKNVSKGSDKLNKELDKVGKVLDKTEKQTSKEDTKSVDGFTDAISNISSALDNVDNISKGIANLEKLGEALHSFNGFDENVKSLNSVAMGIRNLIKAVSEAEGLNENSFGFIAHIKNALDTLANNSAGYGNIGSATTGLSKLLEALNSAKTIDLSKLDQLKAKMLELNNDEFKNTAHELSNSLKELNEAFNLLDNAHEGVIGGMGTITQGFTDAASGLYNVREQIEIISQDFDSVLSPVLNSRLIEILETFRSMNDSYKNVSGIAQGLGSLLAVLLKYKELGETDVEVTPVYSLLESLRALADGSNIIEEVSQKFEKFQGISDAMARLFNAMKYFAIPLDPNQHTVFSYLKGEIENFNKDVVGKFDETRNLLYGFKGVFEALQKDSSAVKDDNLFVALKKQIEDFASLDVGANLKPIGNFLNGVSQIAKAMQDGKGLNQSSPLFEDLKKQLNDLYDWTSRSGAMLDDFGKLANLLRSITDLVNTLGKGVTFNPDNNIITNVVSAINSFDDGVLAKAESISKTFGSLGTMVKSMQKLFWANTRNVTDNLEPIKNFVVDVAALKDDLQGIEKPLSSLSRLMSTVGDASSKVSVEDNALKAIRYQIEDIAKFAPQMAEAEKTIGNLTKLVDSVAASNKKVGDVNSLTRIAEGVKKLDEVQNVEKIGSLANNLTKLVDVMGKNQWDGRKNTAIDKIASGLKKFNEVSDLGKVSSLAKDIKKLIETVAQNEDKVGKDNVITRLVTSLQGFKDITEQTKGLKGTLSAIEKLIRVASEDIDFGKNNPLSQLKRILGGFSDINKGTKGLDKVIKSLMQAIEVMKMVNGKEFSIDPVNNPFALLKEQLEKFVDIIPALENFPKVLKSLKDFIKEFDSTKKFSVDPQPILNIIGAISYAQNLGGAVANFKEMISAIGKLVSKGDSNILAGIGQALGLINKNIAPFATTGKLQSLVDIANAIVKLKDVDVGKIKEIATAIRDIMSAIGQINGSNNTIKINLDERGIINADKGFQNAHRSWEDFKNDVLREVQDIDFSHMFDFDYKTPTKQLREDLKKAQQEMRNAQKEAQRWYESMKKTENIKTPEGAKDVEAYRRAYQNYWQAWTSAGKYKEIVEQLNRVLSARNGYELENDAQGYRARKSLTEERKRLTEMLESMSKNAPSLSVFGDEQGQSAALDTIYDRIRQIDQDLIGINEELPRVGESVEGIKVQTEQLSEVWDEVLKKQREARADISEGFGNFGGLLQGSGNKVLGSIGNLSSMFGKAVEKYGENFSASTIASLTKVAGVLKTLTTALNQVIAVVNVVISIFKAWWDITGKMVDALKQFLQQCIDFAKKMLSAVVGAFNAVAGAVKKVASVVQSAAQLIQDALRKIGEFGGKVISVFGKIGHAVAPAVKGIKAVLSAVTPKFIKTLASGNLQLSKIIKNSHLLGGAIKKITQYFSMMSRMLMRKSITAFLNKMKQAFEDMVMFEKNSNDSMLNLNTNVSKVFSELRRAANQWIAAFEPLINAVAPHVVNFLANIQAMGENVAKFMAILTGQPYYLRAKRFYEDYGESLDEIKKKAKDLTNGLDELNILNDSKDKDSTGINPEDMFEKVPVDGNLQFPEFNIDGIIDSIIDWFDSIPWEEIKQKARDLADRLFDILDAVLRRRDFWYKLGEFFGEGINTALAFIGRAIERWNPAETEAALSALIQGLVDTIDWEYTNAKVRELAQKIADFWNAVFKDDELWKRIQKVAHELCRDIIDFFRDFAWTFDFSNFATRFTEELRKFLYDFPYKDLEEAVGAWVKGFVDFFNTAAKNKPFWKQLGESIAKFITATIAKALKELTNADLADMADSLALAIKTALENIPWTDIDNSIQTIADHIADALIKVFTDEQLLTDISKAVGKIASTIIKALNRIVRRVRNKAREIGQKIARALKKGFAEIPWDEVFTLPANILNTISAFFAGILDEIPSGTELANWITNKLIMGIDAVDWDLIYDNLMRLAEKLRDFISGVLQNGEFWKKAGEVTGKVITITLDFLFELVNINGEDLGEAIKNYINGLIDNVDIGKYLSKTVEIGIKLVTALDVVLTGVDWGKLGDQIAQGIVDAIDTIWKNGGLIQKTIEDAFSVVNNLIKQTLTKMLENDSFRKIGETIGKVLMGIINGLYEFFMLNGDLIIEGIGDLGKSLADFLRLHKAEIISKLNGIIDSLVDIINAIFDEKSELWTELYDIIAGLNLSKLISVIVEKALRALLATLKLREAVWEGVLKSGILEELWKTITEVAGLLWDWLKKKLFNSSNLFEVLTSGGIVGFLKDLIRSILGIDKNGNWNIDLTGIFDGLKFIFSGFKSPITAMIDALKQLFDKDKQKNKGLLDGLFSGLFGNKEQDVPVKVTPTIDDKNIKPITIEDTKFGKISASAIEVTTIKAKELNVEKILAESLTLVDIFADVLHVGEIDTNSNFGHHEDEKRFGANDMGVESGTLSNKPEINASKITTPLLVADLIETDMLEAVEMQTNRIWSALLEVTKIVSDLLKVNTIQAKLLEVSKIVSNRLDVDRINADTLHLDDIYANTLHVGDIDGSISGLTDGIRNIPDDPTPTSFNWDYTPSITPIDWSDYIPSLDWSTTVSNDRSIGRNTNPNITRWSDTHNVPSAWDYDNVNGSNKFDWTYYEPSLPDTSSLNFDLSKYFPSGLRYPNVSRWSDTNDTPSAWEIDGVQKPNRNINDYQDPMQYVHDRLMDMIGNENGVAGIMGNLFEESRFNPSNLQDSYERNGMTDQKYVDWANSNLADFIKDGKGFGLMQVTDPSRKKDFVDQLNGRSVDDVTAQLDFIEYELNHGFKNVKDYLQNVSSPEDAADYVMRKYEKPQIQDSEESRQRGDAARNALEEYSRGFYGSPVNLSDNTIDALSGAITNPLGDKIGGITDAIQLPNGNFLGTYSMPRYEGDGNTLNGTNGLGTNPSGLLPSSSDFTNALKGVDWNKVFQKINWDKLLKKIDWNRLLQNVDLNKLLEKVDWEKIGEALADALNKNFKPEDLVFRGEDGKRYGANDNLVNNGTLENPALGEKQFPDGYLSEQDTHDIYARLRQIWDDTRQFLEDVKKLFEDFDFVDLFLGDDKVEEIKNTLDEILKMFKDFVKDVEDALKEFNFAENLIDLDAINDLLEGAKDKIDSFLVTTKQAFDNFKKDIENLFDGLFDDAFKNLEKQAEDALKKVLKVVEKYVKKIKKKLDELKNAAKDIFKDLAKNGNDEWQKLYGYIELWVGAILEQIKKLKDAAKDMFKDLAKGVDEEWKKVADAVARHVKTILDEIAKLKNAADNLFAKMVGEAEQQWQALFDLVHEWVEKLIAEINRIHDTALNLFFGMDSAAEEEWNKLLELVRQKVADILVELDKLRQAALTMFDGLAEKADEQWKAVYDAVKRWIDEINKLLDDLKAKSLKLFEGMVAAAESDWQNLLAMIQKYVGLIIAEMAKITDAAKKIFNGMVTAADAAWKALYDLIIGWVAKIKALLDQLKNLANNLFKDMATNANTAFQNLYNIIVGWIERIKKLFEGLTQAFRLAIDGMSDAMNEEMREVYDAIDIWLARIAELLQSFFANWNIGLADAVKRELDKAYALIVDWVNKVKKLLEDVFGGLKALTDGKLEVFGTVKCDCNCGKDNTHLDNNTKAKSENTRAVETLNNTVRDWIARCGDNTHLINNTNAKSKNTKAVEQLNNGIQDWINRCGDNTHLINNTNAKSKNTLATEKLITSISNLQGSLGSIKCECSCCGNCSGCDGGSKNNTVNNSSNTSSNTTTGTVKNNTNTTSNSSTSKTTSNTSGNSNNTITKSNTSSVGGTSNNSTTKVTTPSTGGGTNNNSATKVTTPSTGTVDKSGGGTKTTATTGGNGTNNNSNTKDNTKSTSKTDNSGGGSTSGGGGTKEPKTVENKLTTPPKLAVKYGTGELLTTSKDGKVHIKSEEQAKKYDVLDDFIKNRDAANARVDQYRKEAEGLYKQIQNSKYYDKIKASVDRNYKDLNKDANLAGDKPYLNQLEAIKSYAQKAKEYDKAVKDSKKYNADDWSGKLFAPEQIVYNNAKTGYVSNDAVKAANAANKKAESWIADIEKWKKYIDENGNATDKANVNQILNKFKKPTKSQQELIAGGKKPEQTNYYTQYDNIKKKYEKLKKEKGESSKDTSTTTDKNADKKYAKDLAQKAASTSGDVRSYWYTKKDSTDEYVLVREGYSNSANVEAIKGGKKKIYGVGFYSVKDNKKTSLGGTNNATEALTAFNEWYNKSFKVRGYQMGGIPHAGEIFVSRENGTPEFVGSFGNKTAVANNDQIVSAVANGVSMANDSLRNAIENQTNALENAIDRKNLDVQIGDRQIAEANRRGEKGLGQSFIS